MQASGVIPLITKVLGMAGKGALNYFTSKAELKQHKQNSALENAQWVLCHAVTIGSLRRAYAEKPEMAKAYRSLCGAAAQSVLLGEIDE